MRFRHPDGSLIHLAYCTNMHPAEDLDGIIDQLDRFAGSVRRQLDWPLLGVGLWIPAPTAHVLANDSAARDRLRKALDDNRLEAVTLNAFPYEAYHVEVVKQAVMHPNWTTKERLNFTLDMARTLAGIMPDGVEEGTVATLPIGWRTPDPTAAAHENIKALVEGLKLIQQETGRKIRVAFEPEPGCIVESVMQAVDVFAEFDRDWLGICYDACHSAVLFEQPQIVARQLQSAGLPMVKAGLSSALKAADPKRASWLSSFVEPRYNHQVRQRQADGTVTGVDDLDLALDGALDGSGEWRVHFHTPIHRGGDNTTQGELVDVITMLVGGDKPLTRHLEIETYTWTVLPDDQRPSDDQGLVDGIAREMQWAHDRLVEAGLTPV